jgi:cytochrome c oxidase assembly protein Cox11
MDAPRRQTLIVTAFCAVLAVMIGITSYSVTLYRLFCQVTGANGTTQRVARQSTHQIARTVRVRFDTNVAPGLAWQFEPVSPEVTVQLGQDALVFFRARNMSDHAIVGRATFNVTPEKAGLYFKKVQCFCFNEERLEAGASADMPVDFYVDPQLAADRNTADVREITLSYTFYATKAPSLPLELARFAPPDAAAGAKLFAQDCSACHALDHAVIGPALGGVVGRAAAATAYPYSPALKASGVTWTEAALARWLADPKAMVAGTTMPVQVPEEAARRDIVAYLKSAHAGS